MSDDLMGELTKMAEGKIAERLGENQLEELAQEAGLGNASDLIAKATGLFGGHAAQPETSEAPEAEQSEDDEPAQETDDSEMQAEGDND